MTAKAAEAELTAAQEEQLCLEREKNQLLEQLTGSTPTDCDSCAELKTEVELQEKKVGELSGQVEQQSMQIEQLCEELEQQLTAAEENMLNLKEILKATCLERDELRTAAEEASQNGLAGAEPETVVLSVQDLEFAVPAPMPPPCPYPEGSRKYKLFQVFIEFDLDNSGEILTEELLELGKARRKLGQKSGEWTEEKNAKLVKKIDVNGDGMIAMSEFIDFFAEALPRNRGEFAEIVQQFMEVAASLRKKKVEAKAVQGKPVAGPAEVRILQAGGARAQVTPGGGDRSKLNDVLAMLEGTSDKPETSLMDTKRLIETEFNMLQVAQLCELTSD